VTVLPPPPSPALSRETLKKVDEIYSRCFYFLASSSSSSSSSATALLQLDSLLVEEYFWAVDHQYDTR